MSAGQEKKDATLLTKQNKMEPNQDQMRAEMKASLEKMEVETRSGQEKMRAE
jgi:hypothetical protein